MVNTVYWLPIGGPAVPADWLGPKVDGHLAPLLYSSREPSELSQWLCHDDSTINIIVVIIIIIIIVKCHRAYLGKCSMHVQFQTNSFTSILLDPVAVTVYFSCACVKMASAC